MISVLVVDDHPAIRHLLETLLHAATGIRCVGSAADAAQAIALAERHKPDVVLMDISMARGDGVAAAIGIRDRCPRARVVALAAWRSGRLQAGALDAGASARLLKDGDLDVLLGAIRGAAVS